MRIVQIIDSLEVGGAEKMAVNYANALSDDIEFSGLIATRKEGELKFLINDKVNYLFLKKNKLIDFKAVFKLRKYCIEHKIDIIHSHSTSYFISLLVKFILPKIKIVWHDHNGLSEYITRKETFALKIASLFFKGIIVVNHQLKNWADKELYCKNVLYLPNFTNVEISNSNRTVLNGIEGKRILCLANLRPQKNHFLLIDVAKKLKANIPDWSFHIVGKDFNDEYSSKVKQAIQNNNLQNNVFIYGSKNDISNIMNQCEIAVLTSNSEGLPVALIDYGLHKKAVISTAVGEIPNIINHTINGYLVNARDVDKFYYYLVLLIKNESIRKSIGDSLYNTIIENNSKELILNQYYNWLNQ